MEIGTTNDSFGKFQGGSLKNGKNREGWHVSPGVSLCACLITNLNTCAYRVAEFKIEKNKLHKDKKNETVGNNLTQKYS